MPHGLSKPAHDQVKALTTFECSTSEDSNDALISEVTETLTLFTSVLIPILHEART